MTSLSAQAWLTAKTTYRVYTCVSCPELKSKNAGMEAAEKAHTAVALALCILLGARRKSALSNMEVCVGHGFVLEPFRL